MLIKSYRPILIIIIISIILSSTYGIFWYYIKYENIKQENLLEQEQLYRNLINDTYVLDRIKDKLIGYDYIILQSPIDLREKMGGSLDYYDLVKNFTSMPTSHVRFFIAYQHAPDKINPMEKNHFYIGFIDMRGDVYHLPRDSGII
jgi:hypothetical protein